MGFYLPTPQIENKRKQIRRFKEQYQRVKQYPLITILMESTNCADPLMLIDRLDKQEYIKEFYKEYISLLRERIPKDPGCRIKDPEELAKHNLTYIINEGIISVKKELWVKSLPFLF